MRVEIKYDEYFNNLPMAKWAFFHRDLDVCPGYGAMMAPTLYYCGC